MPARKHSFTATEIKAGLMRRVTNYNIKPLPWELMNVHDDTAGPDMTLFPKAIGRMWQTGSRRKPLEVLSNPLYNHPYDWTYWLGDFASLWAWVKKEVYVPPTDPTPVPLTIESLAVQMGDFDARLRKIESLPWYKQFFSIVNK